MATVVTLVIGGVPHRYADVALEVLDPDGDWAQIPAGVLRAELDLPGETSPGGATVEVDVFPLDLAELAELGHVLAGLPAEVADVTDGQAWADREVLCTGATSDLTYGELGRPMACQIGATWLDQGQLPPPGAVVTSTTWPNSQDGERGKVYPWIIGRPTSAPVRIVDTTGNGLGLVAGHPVLAVGSTIAVRSRGASPGARQTMTIVHTTDGSGRTIAAIELVPWLASVDDVVLEADWSGSAGGHYGVTGAGCPRSVPDVALVLLSYATVAVDRGAWRAASWARPYLLDVYLIEPAAPLDILRDAMRGLPGRIEAGPSGIRPVGTTAAEVSTQPVGVTLDDGTVDIDPSITVTGSLPPAVVNVRYATDAIAGSTTAVATLEVAQGPRAGRRAATYAPTSGVGLAVEEVTAGHVCDPQTAHRIAASIARERVSRRVLAWTHEAGATPHATLGVGDRVALSHTGLHLTARRAVIEAAEPDLLAGTRRLTARLIDD